MAKKVKIVKEVGVSEKRDKLIKLLQSKLLTNEQVKKGGSVVRVRYEQEKGYVAVVDEINEIGRELGLPDVSIGSLRR